MTSRRQASRGGPKRFCRTTYACMRFGISPTGGRSLSSYRSAMSPPVSCSLAVGAPTRPPEPDARRSLPVELLYQSRQAWVVEPRLVRLVERCAAEQPRVALLDLPADRLIRPGHGERVHHLVGDHVGHARPVPLDGLPVLAAHGWQDLTPALHRKSIEGDWTGTANAITDERVDTCPVTGAYATIGRQIQEREGGLRY